MNENKIEGLGRFYDYPPALPATVWDEVRAPVETALYINIPYCKRFCFYCPFTKQIPTDGGELEAYEDLVIRELSLISESEVHSAALIECIYFGGGTPSLLPASSIARIINAAKDFFRFSRHCAITVEANASSTSVEWLEGLKEAEVGRVSFGVQSFDESTLKALGCNHSNIQAIQAIRDALDCGLQVNADLLYRLPGQTLAGWKNNLSAFFSTGAHHLSTYALDLAPTTPLYKLVAQGREKPLPDDSCTREMIRATDEAIEENGFIRYTVDQASLKGKENAYSFFVAKKNVIGVGAGAFSNYNGWVYRNFKKVHEYSELLKKGMVPVELGKKLSSHEQAVRYLVKNLLFLNVDLKEFHSRFGVEANAIVGDAFEKFDEEGLGSLTSESFSLSFEGRVKIFELCRRLFSKDYAKLIEEFESRARI